MGKTIEIKVGTIFTVKEPPGQMHLIVNTGENNWFVACRCIIATDGSIEVIGGLGSSEPEYIQEIIRTVDPNTVPSLVLAQLAKNTFGNIDENTINIHRREIGGKPRKITID
jgi:hypothetical protein